MAFSRPSRLFHHSWSVVRTVVVGSALSVVLPVHATGTADFRRVPLGQTLGPPSAWIELSLPTSILDVPVDLRFRTPYPPPSYAPENGSLAMRGVAVARPPGSSRQAVPIPPAVTILTPTDLATIPTGILRVRGS